ncbi:hypothetical protein K440DRAFT_213080 [Wilcoxina mikolae CBS 423.85]|nr:hypothetical protein K440DRAFT_213080 [Wilcoxina mikolae CBS 423.85]
MYDYRSNSSRAMSVKSPNPIVSPSESTATAAAAVPSKAAKKALKPSVAVTIAEPSTIQQFLRTLIHDDNQTFVDMVRNGGRVIIDGVNKHNYDTIVESLDEQARTSSLYKSVKFNYYGSEEVIILEIPGAGHEGPCSVINHIQNQLKEQQFTKDSSGSIVANLQPSFSPSIKLDYLGSSIIQTPDGGILNEGFEQFPWLIVEVANTQTYAEALDKIYAYLLGSGGKIAYGIIINLIKPAAKKQSNSKTAESKASDTNIRVPLQDNVTVTVQPETSTEHSPGSQLGSIIHLFHKATISIFKRAVEDRPDKDGRMFPTSVIQTIHDKIEVYPAIPSFHWVIKWFNLPFSVKLNEEEKDKEYKIEFTELHAVIKRFVMAAKIANGDIEENDPAAVALRSGARWLPADACDMTERVAAPPGALKRRLLHRDTAAEKTKTKDGSADIKRRKA